MRRLADRIVGVIADLAALGWFRSVDRSGLERIPEDAPVLIVANHGGGFVDPALLASALPRMPRFLAMARLWKNIVARPLLMFAGAIPVYRAEDGGTSANRGTFDACHDVLEDGGVVAIFPEGHASDLPHLMPVKTGAARIALGARSAGARGITIVPVGLTYEDKTRARSRAYVRVGDPLELDEHVERFVAPGEPEGEENHRAVHELTEEIRARLERTSPNYRDAAQLAALGLAAEIALRPAEQDPRRQPPMGAMEDLATRLAAEPDAALVPIRRAVEEYRDALEAHAATDAVVAGGGDRGFGLHLASAILTLIGLPFALIGLLTNAVPALAVYLVGRRPMAPVTRATTKFLVALVVFPATWSLTAFWASGRIGHPWIVTTLVGPICGLAALWTADRLRRARRAHLDLRRVAGPRSALEDLRTRRERVVQAVDAAAAPGSAARSRW